MRSHYLVRGVFTCQQRVLVAHAMGADNTFLPGGHIEAGEKAVDALIREIREEIGVTPVVGEFAGAIEHTWSDAGTDQHELNLVFRMELSAVNPAGNPASREKHLEFFWLDIEDLGKHNLLPAPMIDIVREANNHSKGFWASTIGD